MTVDEQTVRAQELDLGTSPCPRRLTHVNMTVADWEKSLDYYVNVIGLEETYRRTPVNLGLSAGFLSNGNTHHDVAVASRAGVAAAEQKVKLNHIAFELESEAELVRSYHRCKAADVIAVTQDHDNTHSIYCDDLAGTNVEIYTDFIKNWRAIKSGTLVRNVYPWAPGAEPPSTATFYQEEPEIRRVENAVFHPLRITHAVLVVAAPKYQEAYDYYTVIWPHGWQTACS